MKILFIEKKTIANMLILSAMFAVLAMIPGQKAFCQCGTITVSPPSLPDGMSGNYYSQTITASGGMSPYTYYEGGAPFAQHVLSGSEADISFAAAPGLPPGLSLSSSGLISGVPYVAGAYNFDVYVEDAYYCSATKNYTITILEGCSSIIVTPEVLRDGTVDRFYKETLTSIGGTAPYHYSVCLDLSPSNGHLPPGLDLTDEGVISGIPSAEGEYSFGICVEDSSPFFCTGNAWYTIVINKGCPLITLSPPVLPAAMPGVAYTQALTANGGLLPYTYYLGGGTLPPGLTLDTRGTLSGTPAQAGDFNFLVMAKDSSNCDGGQSYSLSVGCASQSGTLSGAVGISAAGTGVFYPLDGPDISGTVTASGSDGADLTAEIVHGSFSFGDVPSGQYHLVANLHYKDHIPYDADLLTSGCPAPENGAVIKDITSTPRLVDVPCDSRTYAQLEFDGPIVMLHGILDCYEKWYERDAADPDFSKYWDNYARNHGVISFTPNYEWWGDNGSWLTRTDEVVSEINSDMASLTTHGIIPFVIVSHDMGGLVARVMGSPIYDADPVVSKIIDVYLLGTPNSGIDLNQRMGKKGLLGPNSIIRYFNDAYPDFGRLNVYAIAGNDGWWNTTNNDGKLTLYSAFNITRVACKGDDCVSYPAVTLESGNGHIFHYNHKELGCPQSVGDIFDDVILTQGKLAGSPRKHGEGVPEAPTGAVGWGTVGRSSATMSTGHNSLLAESAQNYPFTVSKCDGMAVFVTVTGGSADFKIVDPSNWEFSLTDNMFLQTAPAPGTWNLKVTPGPNGVTFNADAIDNSIFGIKAYLTSQFVIGGENDSIRVDRDGDWAMVNISTINAIIYDDAGNLIQTVSLNAGAGYYSAEFTAPSAPGAYQMVVKAEGTYDGSAFSRWEFETLNVLPPSHLFSGAFSDSPADSDGNGKYDAISLTAAVNALPEGLYILSADIFDSEGNFVAHSTTDISASGSGSYQAVLVFPLAGITCGQLENSLEVTDLKLLDANYLTPLDVWNSAIKTKSYASSQFECVPGYPSPAPAIVMPAKGVRGATTTIALSGKNFQNGCSIAFDSGVTVNSMSWYNNRVLVATITTSSSASLGYHSITVTNPDGKSGALSGTFSVTVDNPPQVVIENPSDESVIGGIVNVTAGAYDDVKVTKVVFELDGAVQSTVDSFPFIWVWDTTKSSSGDHVIKATASDSAGQQSTAESAINAVQPPVVASISKKTGPFRLVVLGKNIHSGIAVYINDELYTNVKWKSSSKLVIKGGPALKDIVRQGVDTKFRFVNPDSGEAIVIWRW
jgi:hypothetical protein